MEKVAAATTHPHSLAHTCGGTSLFTSAKTFFFPNHQRWRAKMEAQWEYVHVAYTLLHVLAPICYAQLVLRLSSASELSRKFVKSALLVGFSLLLLLPKNSRWEANANSDSDMLEFPSWNFFSLSLSPVSLRVARLLCLISLFLPRWIFTPSSLIPKFLPTCF